MSFIPVYVLILFLMILVDYLAAIFIEKSEGKKRKFFFICSISVTILILFIFKYFNFFNVNIHAIAVFFHWNYSLKALSLILPIGLSFHTFQSMSYVIEVYKRNFKAEKNLGVYALYVMFYPQLVAGPIERPQNLLHQFYETHFFQYNRIVNGLKLMLWGFFKKIVIADNLAIVVNAVYNNPTDYSGFPLILATVFFAFQLYCDFSGYSDIAIGSAYVMGFKLMTNFNRPYFSRSISEFWNRWHISLSTWFKDYVYQPFIQKKLSMSRIYWGLFITFLISGIWHGANWTFAIWGSLHGLYLVISLFTANIRRQFVNKIGLDRHKKVHAVMQILITFMLVNVGYIFFRANSLSDAIYIISHLFSNLTGSFIMFVTGASSIARTGRIAIFWLIFLIIFLQVIQYLQGHINFRKSLSKLPIWLEWGIYLIGSLFILLFGALGRHAFIYFQF